MTRQRTARRERDSGTQPPLVGLVSRLMFAQVCTSAVIGLTFNRRNGPVLLLTVFVVLSVGVLAVFTRSATHSAWLLAVGVEAFLLAMGVVLFVVHSYLGGSLFALVTLGTLLHPAVARQFSARPLQHAAGVDEEAPAKSTLP